MDKENPTQIEEVLAHQEIQIQDMNEMIVKQWDEIDALKQEVKILRDKIGVLQYTSDQGEAEGLSVAEQALRDKPPHY